MTEYLNHPDQKFGGYSYAQHGDDLMILNLFQLIGVDKPNYLDIGAHHAFRISNTALLHERGSRGVNVEANPSLYKELVKMRPLDTHVNVGVGPARGEFPFYMYSETSGRNTFSAEEAKLVPGMTIKRVVNVEVITINQIVDEYCNGVWPNLLLTDIEGYDEDVLSTADFSSSSPMIICTEARRGKSGGVKMILQDRGYFCYCRMGENLFFIRQEFSHLVY